MVSRHAPQHGQLPGRPQKSNSEGRAKPARRSFALMAQGLHWGAPPEKRNKEKPLQRKLARRGVTDSSEPAPWSRPWASAWGATPRGRTYPNMTSLIRLLKPDISTWHEDDGEVENGQLLMTQKERDRLAALKKAQNRLITQSQAAEEIGVSERQVRRMLAALTAVGRQSRASRQPGQALEPRHRRRRATTGDSSNSATLFCRGFGPNFAAIICAKNTPSPWAGRRCAGG